MVITKAGHEKWKTESPRETIYSLFIFECGRCNCNVNPLMRSLFKTPKDDVSFLRLVRKYIYIFSNLIHPINPINLFHLSFEQCDRDSKIKMMAVVVTITESQASCSFNAIGEPSISNIATLENPLEKKRLLLLSGVSSYVRLLETRGIFLCRMHVRRINMY